MELLSGAVATSDIIGWISLSAGSRDLGGWRWQIMIPARPVRPDIQIRDLLIPKQYEATEDIAKVVRA
jgi:hypothetical protein